jgi:hypothetical protein
MESMLETMNVTIPSGKTLRVRDAGGLSLRIVEGTAWITEDGNPNDYSLAEGEVRLVASDGLMRVHAFEETLLSIAAPRGSNRATVEMGAGYNEFAAAVWWRSVADVVRRFMQNRVHEAGDPVLQER